MLIDANTWQANTGVTLSTADAVSCAAICAQVDAALKRVLLPYAPEPLTVTYDILDGLPRRELLLRYRPVQSIVNLWLNDGAEGVFANFDLVNDLLVAGTDYELVIDDPVGQLSRAGIVRRIGGNVWSARYRRHPGTLAPQLAGSRGSVLASYVAGEASVPADVQAAAQCAVSLLMQRRATGAPLQSESWNGYSASTAGPFTAEAAVNSPEVAAFLRPYRTPKFG